MITIINQVFVYFIILLNCCDKIANQSSPNTAVDKTQQPTLNERNPTTPWTFLIRTWPSTPPPPVQIICKKNEAQVGTAGPILNGASTSFEEFIRQSHSWPDKSKLIRDIVYSNCRTIFITSPRRWDKAINLNMIQKFIEIPIAKDGRISNLSSSFAYNYFVKGIVPSIDGHMNISVSPLPVISNYPQPDAISEHLGKHPVIHIDFSNVSLDIDSVKSIIAGVFAEHEYVLAPYIKNYKNTSSDLWMDHTADVLQEYHKIQNMEIEEGGLTYSIEFLSELLFNFHKKRVMLLIDEYDNFINQLDLPQFDNEKLKKRDLFSFYCSFLISSVKANEHLEHAVLTGIPRNAEFIGVCYELGDMFHSHYSNPNPRYSRGLGVC